MLCCTCLGLLAVLCTTPVLQQSFLRIRQTIFQWYFNVKSHLKYLCNYKSWMAVCCLHFFIDGVESAWPARYFFSPGNHTDYRLLRVIILEKRFRYWPWSYIAILFPHFSSNWTCILNTKMQVYTVPLKCKLPVASRFRRDANRVAQDSPKRKCLA